jgi:hypothetical protein
MRSPILVERLQACGFAMTAGCGGPPRADSLPMNLRSDPLTHFDHEFTLADKVDFLSRTASYLPRPRRVRSLETHMSWLFLVGD